MRISDWSSDVCSSDLQHSRPSSREGRIMNMMSLKGVARAMRRRLRDEPPLRLAAARADAFLVSYPKSGRTWLRYLLSCYFAESAKLGFEPDLTSTFRILPNFDRDRKSTRLNSSH